MSALARAALAQLRSGDCDGALAAVVSPADAAELAVRGMAQLAAGDWPAALVALRSALALGDASPPTLLNLALAEDRTGLDGRGRMRAVADLWPEWAEPRLRLAESFRREGDAPLAMVEYERALALDPDRGEALLGLAALLLLAGEAARARPLLLRCCAVAPRVAEAWDALGMTTRAADDPAAASGAFAEAARLRPQAIGMALRRTEAAAAAGFGAAELARLAAATEADPLDAAQATAYGVLLHRQGQDAAALGALEAAVALAPDAPEPAAALAESLQRTSRLDAAVAALRRAVALAPDSIALRNNLAATLTRMHQYREARDLLAGLVVEFGEHPAFLCNLSNALVLLGQQAEGVAAARRATELAPNMHLAWRTLGAASVYVADEGAAAALLGYGRRAAATLPAPSLPPPSADDPDRRLRLGLLSTKLRTHPVGWLTIAAFEALDPAGFEIVCLAGEPADDALARRFQAVAAEWHDVAALPVAAAAARVRALGIDVLLDLSGWGDDGLLTVCAERPAPVQIKWVGNQAASTGLAAMDWFLTDRWETPDGFERFYSERLLRMPDGYACYAPPDYAPAVAALPALTAGAVTFGCFNNLAKITPSVIAAWAAILRRVPGSRLLLKSYQLSDRLTASEIMAAFAAHDIAAARLLLRGASAHRAQLDQHNEVDIILDPFPYSGGLTTCEALWMGVPVVTLPGESFASRHSASHLSNVGLPEWVAADAEGYAAIAVRAAADLPALARLRAGLRAQMRASPLCDAPRFARHLGAALRGAWRQACARP